MKVVLTAAAVVALTGSAWAQGQGRGFGMGGMGGGPGILMAENVQKDLKLTEDQKSKVQDTIRGIMESRRDEMQALRDASPEERQTKMAAMQKSMADEAKKALGLTADQSKRFDQIGIQARGIQAFADPAIASKLNLTADQKSKLSDLGQGAREKLQQIRDSANGDFQEMAKQMAAYRREQMTKVQAMLSDAQKGAWKDLTGEPIEIQMPAFRPNQ
jgi:Spy/CpxP family protein refolding chaperone